MLRLSFSSYSFVKEEVEGWGGGGGGGGGGGWWLRRARFDETLDVFF